MKTMSSLVAIAAGILAVVLVANKRDENRDRARSLPSAPNRPSTSQPPQKPRGFGLPDLVIVRGWSESPSPVVAPGTHVRFRFQVQNRGTAPANGFIQVSGPGGHSGGFVGGLRPGETKTATVSYPFYSRGATHALRFTVDADNVIRESNEENNTSQPFTVRTSF